MGTTIAEQREITGLDLCSRCGDEERAPGQRWCRTCRNRYMRENRPKYSELPEADRRKSSVRGQTHYLVRCGRIKRQPCERCGEPKAEAHHPDYARPDLVEWLCVDCHRTLHRTPSPELVRLIQKWLASG
jgi:ribosomal protein S27AE